MLTVPRPQISNNLLKRMIHPFRHLHLDQYLLRTKFTIKKIHLEVCHKPPAFRAFQYNNPIAKININVSLLICCGDDGGDALIPPPLAYVTKPLGEEQNLATVCFLFFFVIFFPSCSDLKLNFSQITQFFLNFFLDINERIHCKEKSQTQFQSYL